ncbi:hypothetical protein BASA81_012971 [Batrachochytrium salamandrivorans]|nr:hypothetical protein BASA81_012971 [Batrachochytrium salamandrivorans]
MLPQSHKPVRYSSSDQVDPAHIQVFINVPPASLSLGKSFGRSLSSLVRNRTSAILTGAPSSLPIKPQIAFNPRLGRSVTTSNVVGPALSECSRMPYLLFASSSFNTKKKSINSDNPSVVLSDEIRSNWQQLKHKIAMERVLNQRRHVVPGNARTSVLGESEMASAATAAADLLETLTRFENASTSAERRAVRRAVRETQRDSSYTYLQTMRHMGADIEELMMMEAIRLSLNTTDAQPYENISAAAEAEQVTSVTTAPVYDTGLQADPPLVAFRGFLPFIPPRRRHGERSDEAATGMCILAVSARDEGARRDGHADDAVSFDSLAARKSFKSDMDGEGSLNASLLHSAVPSHFSDATAGGTGG